MDGFMAKCAVLVLTSVEALALAQVRALYGRLRCTGACVVRVLALHGRSRAQLVVVGVSVSAGDAA